MTEEVPLVLRRRADAAPLCTRTMAHTSRTSAMN
jgi:hypothetical protein